MNVLSGYIEIDLGDKKVPFKFGSNAWALFCEMHKIDLWQISESGVLGRWEDGKMLAPPDLIKMRDLFYCAHVAASRAAGVNELVNLYKLGDMLDEDRNVSLKLQEVMIQSKMFGINLQDAGKEDSEGNFQTPV